jgi:hypothetical protein
MTKILVVDRVQSVREALAFVLELEGHDVVQAADGRQALDRAASTWSSWMRRCATCASTRFAGACGRSPPRYGS